jgi:uncharacterized membrane protein
MVKQPFFVGIKIVHCLLKINWFCGIIYILRVLSIIIRLDPTQRVNLGLEALVGSVSFKTQACNWLGKNH